MSTTATPVTRRAVLSGAGALTLAGLVAACSGNGTTNTSAAATGKSVEIVTCNFDPFVQEITTITGAGYTQRTGITVTPINTGGPSYESVDQRVQSDLAAGHTDAVAMIGLNSLDNYVSAGRCVALDALAHQAGYDTSQLYPTMLDLGTRDSQLYGMPHSVSTLLMFYNADAFRKAGLDPDKPPTTFSELQNAAKALVSAGLRYGATFKNDASGNWCFQNFLRSRGGTMAGPDGKTPTFNQSAGVAVLDYWTKLFAAGLGKTMTGTEMNAAFGRGDLGIMLNSSSYVKTILDGSKFDVRAAPMPIPDGGQRKCVAGGDLLVILTRDAAQQKSAFDAISELVGPAGITTLVKATGYTAVNQVAATQPAYLKTFLDSNPLFAANTAQIDDLVPWFGWPGQHAAEIEKAIDQQITLALRGSTTPQAALDAAASRAKNLLGS